MRSLALLLGIAGGVGSAASAGTPVPVPAVSLHWSGSITTVAKLANGDVITSTAPLDVTHYFADAGTTLPSVRVPVVEDGYVDNSPPRLPPPDGIDPRVSIVTLELDNGVQTRTTTYERRTTDGVDGVTGEWRIGAEAVSNDAKGG